MNDALPSFSSNPEPRHPDFMAGFPKPGDAVIVKRTSGDIDREGWTIHQMPDLTPFMAPELIADCRVIVKARDDRYTPPRLQDGEWMLKHVRLGDLLEWQKL